MTVVVGTAGHIDHGKTTLLRALTGIDADRLPEERARGMTIDVGYAHLAFDDGTELDFVDVPGHDRLVGNMLVGAGEIDAALLVVAADDGPRAQTIEHLELLDALAIADAVVAITKTDLVPVARAIEVADALGALLRGTSIAGSPIVGVSPATGRNVEQMRTVLAEMRDRVLADQGAASGAGARLAIDRAFSIRGRGTVVTGTLRGGSLARGALLRLVPGPAFARVRVRELQVHNHVVDEAGPGRTALNVTGDAVADLRRGTVLTTDPTVVASDRLLVAVRPPAPIRSASSSKDGPPLRDGMRVVVHAGTAHVSGRIGRTQRETVDLSDGESVAVLRLDAPIAVAPGDRFALRRPSPAATLGGGRVLDADPPRGVARRRSTPDRLVALASAAPGSDALRAARLELHGAIPTAAPALAPDVADALDRAIVTAAEPGETRRADLVRAGSLALRREIGARARADEFVAARIDALEAEGSLVREGDRYRTPGSAAAPGPDPDLLAAMDRLVALLSAPAPPALSAAAHDAGCPPAGIRMLEQSGRIVTLDDDLAWARETWAELASRALAMAAVAPLTPAAFRDATGISRKYVLALLEDLDRRAVLRRAPEGHVPGPRAARLGVAEPRAPR
jgi:selenocysteine-specific elongation factor